MDYLAAWQRFADLTYADIPENVKTVAHQCVLDWFGCAIAGSEEPLAGILREEFAHRAGQCSIIGAGLNLEPATAALLNGASGHALDFDDTSASVGCHATAPVFPAVLAAAEELGASGAELMAAFIVGVEIEGRVGNAIGAEHYFKGWHTTATYGTFGAAAGVAHLMKLNADQYATAMGLAASAASGVKANFGTMTKPYHAGQAAERGLVAARLAARGFTANPDAINGNQGYVQAAGTGTVNTERLAKIADQWLILDSLFKYHAACYLTHASIESVLRLRTKVRAEDLSSITLTVNPTILDVCGIPEPHTGLEGKFSLRGNTALAWLGLDTSNPDTYVDEVINRADVQALLDKVNVETNNELTSMQTRVACVDNDQSAYEEYFDTSIPASDLTEQGKKLKAKFASLSGQRSDLGDALLSLGEQPTLTALRS